MKKKIRLENGESIVAEVDSPTIHKAVIQLFNATGKRLVLLVEENSTPEVFLLVGYNPQTRTLEYQVSDGMDGRRSSSFDFYNLKEAIACFDNVCNKGWENI